MMLANSDINLPESNTARPNASCSLCSQTAVYSVQKMTILNELCYCDESFGPKQFFTVVTTGTADHILLMHEC